MSVVRCPWGTRGSADCRQYGSPKCSGRICGCDVVSLVAAGRSRFAEDRAKAVAPSTAGYQFPATKWSQLPPTLDNITAQARAIQSEAAEVHHECVLAMRRAVNGYDLKDALFAIAVENRDTHVASETLARLLEAAGVDPAAVDAEVLRKTERRGYWIGEVGV